MVDELSEPIPGVSESELIEAAQNLTIIPATELEDHERFMVSVRALVEARAQAGWGNEGSADVGVFVLAPYPRELGERFGAKAVSDLIATSDPILGRLFFLNRDASNGRGMDLPTTPNEMLDWLVNQKLEKLTVILAYRNKNLLISRSKGVSGDSRKDIIRDKAPDVTVAEIYEALKLVHREILLTPGDCPGVWEDGRSAQYVPGVSPEKVIQREVRTALLSWFHGLVKAEMEDKVSIGRIDIRLLRRSNDRELTYWVILELKVIRSKHNAPKNKRATEVKLPDNAAAVVEGIRQASSFGKNRGAEPFLEIYDLRKDKSVNILAHALVADELSKHDPKPGCRVWPLYGSASDARIAGWS